MNLDHVEFCNDRQGVGVGGSVFISDIRGDDDVHTKIDMKSRKTCQSFHQHFHGFWKMCRIFEYFGSLAQLVRKGRFYILRFYRNTGNFIRPF